MITEATMEVAREEIETSFRQLKQSGLRVMVLALLVDDDGTVFRRFMYDKPKSYQEITHWSLGLASTQADIMKRSS